MPSKLADAVQWFENNDTTYEMTVTQEDGITPLDVSDATGREVEFIIKTSVKTADIDGTTLSTATGEIIVTDGPNGRVVAYVARTVLTPPGKRAIRGDVIDATDRKTFLYGNATVVDL